MREKTPIAFHFIANLTRSAQASASLLNLGSGMAGSGKTTFLQRLNAHMHQHSMNGYIINLDPAVLNVPYSANVDIRDTVRTGVVMGLHLLSMQTIPRILLIIYTLKFTQVNYKNVMKQYELGPNGGILTSLNLFATRFDQVIALCEKPRSPPLEYIVVDTPGQIEIFTWSASGSIITEAFASSFPTMVAYVMDTPRCASPQSFMANMLQACSILYKSRLPLLLVFNKIDVTPHDFAIEWMTDYDAFSAALDSDASYAATLSRSLSLVLEEFYQNLQAVGVSAVTGQGMDEFFESVQRCKEKYTSEYLPDLRNRLAQRDELEAKRREADWTRLKADMSGEENPANPRGDGGPADKSDFIT